MKTAFYRSFQSTTMQRASLLNKIDGSRGREKDLPAGITHGG